MKLLGAVFYLLHNPWKIIVTSTFLRHFLILPLVTKKGTYCRTHHVDVQNFISLKNKSSAKKHPNILLIKHSSFNSELNLTFCSVHTSDFNWTLYLLYCAIIQKKNIFFSYKIVNVTLNLQPWFCQASPNSVLCCGRLFYLLYVGGVR